jgi:uncharacterized protein (TIGR02246 family)
MISASPALLDGMLNAGQQVESKKHEQQEEDAMLTRRRSLGLLTILTLVGCAPTPDTRAADEAAIRAAVQEWAEAARAKDADKFASFYVNDAVLMLGGAPDVVGKPSIRETIGKMMQDPNFALTFATANVVVARSGDIAYETGSYELTTSDANQQPARERGRYVVVWRKESDGTWKAAIDAPNSDTVPPPAAPAEPPAASQ